MQNVSEFNLLDILVKMTNSKSNADTLTAELEDIKSELNYKRRTLNNLQDSITDDKYFDASSEIVDRNIEISTSKKIRNLEYVITDLNNELKELQTTEKNALDEIHNLENKIANFESYLEVVDLRKQSSQNDDVVNLYTEIDEQEKQNLEELKKDLIIKRDDYEVIATKVKECEELISNNETQLASERDKLTEIQSNLANKSAYINHTLKKQDEEDLNRLKAEVEKLEKRIDEINNDPVYIVSNIKEMIANNDRRSVDKELSHLINEIEKLPYMNINSDEELNDIFDQAKQEYENFISYIENKRYEGMDTPIIEERIEYLKNEIIAKSEQIENLKSTINNIDTNSIREIEGKIRTAESIRKELEEEIKTYKEENEPNNGRKKASVQASLNRKNSELKEVNELINAYLADQRSYIEQANNYETNIIAGLQEQITNYENEINELKKLLILKNKSKDVVEMDKDQEKLQELSKNLEMIKYRGEFKTTPRKIVSDIRKKIGLDFEYRTDNDTEENLDEEYQDMLNTPSFNDDNELTDLQSTLLNNPIYKQESPAKLKVISVTPYEPEVEQLPDINLETPEETLQTDDIKEDVLWD
ncbi:MAG: hypothetical protein IJ574_00515 [Bacilli bacterium]|nr:hypothetical protein [Bacilli bacterium]